MKWALNMLKRLKSFDVHWRYKVIKPVITIHQPEHMPWLGFFNKMLKSEIFVILDNVQFEKNYYQNRNRILGNNGAQWLNVPTETKGHMDKTIREIKIANTTQPNWKKKYLLTLELNYCKHPFFNDIFPPIKNILEIHDEYLCDLNVSLILYFAQLLNADCQFLYASQMNLNGKKSNLIYQICKQLGAGTYISGSSGRDYMNLDVFCNDGIQVKFNDYVHPIYAQKKSFEFVPYLSVLDLLMNKGPDEAHEIILSGLPK